LSQLLEINALVGGYANKNILNGIDLNVDQGEIVGLIGLNGAGKSTTIKHIIGLLKEKSGSIKIHGETCQADPESYRKAIGYVPEQPVLYEGLTLYEHLRLTAQAYDISEDDFKLRLPKLLKDFRLEKELHFYPVHFSKGMRQKVMIMCAFLIEPSLYIIAEPFVGLDPLAIHSFIESVKTMRDKGAGVLMSTHILANAEKYCDRFIVIHHGKIRAEGTLAALREQFGMVDASLDDLYIQLTKEEANV